MNRLSTAKRAQIIGCLVEGMSLRATSRLVGVSINTVTKLLVDLGEACAEYQDGALVDLPTRRLQVDEIWAFVYSKAKNVPEDKRGEYGYGDVWTWTALDADSKLMVSWVVGERGYDEAEALMLDVASRLRERPQLTTDGWKVYPAAVDAAFGSAVDYAQIVKMYGKDPKGDERRYSPAVCTGVEIRVQMGDPDRAHISTSFVERSNLTMRMGMRRFTRLTNAFSKKVENHAHAVAIHFMHYNFARVHKSLKGPKGYPQTPAMAAGVTDHVWTLEEIAGLLETPKARRSN